MAKKISNVKMRELFHKILNLLNKITIKSGVTIGEARLKDMSSMTTDELRSHLTKSLDALKIIETSAHEIGSNVDELKAKVYVVLGMDKPKPK